MGDDDRLREPVDPGKGVALHESPRLEKSLPGVCRGGRHDQPEHASEHQRHGSKRQPEPVPRPRQGRAEIVAARHLGDLADRRLAEHPRARLLAGIADKLDNPEELIAKRREAAGDKPCQLVKPARSPHPAIKRHRENAAGGDRSGIQRKPRQDRRVGEPIGEEKRQPGDEDAEEGDADRLDSLHSPDGGTKIVELPAQRSRERKGRVSWNGRLRIGRLALGTHGLSPARESTFFILPFSPGIRPAAGARSLHPAAIRAPATCAPPRKARAARRARRE